MKRRWTTKNIPCVEIEVDSTHNILIMERNSVYDCYIMEQDGSLETPYFYMFGLVMDDVGLDNAIEIAVANAPDFYDLIDEANA